MVVRSTNAHSAICIEIKNTVKDLGMKSRSEIDLMAKQLPDTTRIFLADGDALNLSTDYMVKITEYLYNNFQKLERVSCYAMPMNLLKKNTRRIEKNESSWLEHAIPWNRKWF